LQGRSSYLLVRAMMPSSARTSAVPPPSCLFRGGERQIAQSGRIVGGGGGKG